MGQNSISDFMGLSFQFELIFRLVISCFAGALIGFERKRRQKEAGMRTHIMVALASALFAVCSKYGYFDVVVIDSVSVDASRIGANIVTGVAFLGAGMIFVKSKTISGLTTAAGIWAISGVGLCFGSGLYMVGSAGTIIMVIVQYLLHNVLNRMEGTSTREITIILDNSDNVMDDFLNDIKKIDSAMYLSSVSRREGSYNIIQIKVNVRVEKSELTDDIWEFMKRYPYVISSSL